MSNFSPTVLVTNVAHQLDPTSFIELDPTSLTGLDVQLFANAFNGQIRLEAPVCDNIACGRAHLATQSDELFLCCAPFLFAWYVYFFLLGTSISFLFTPPMEIHGSVYSKIEVIADPSVSYP